MRFNLEKIRADFPILSEKIHNNRLVYLDSGASAQKPQVVIDSISNTYSSSYANVHRGLHTLSNRATEEYEAARGKVQRFIGAARSDEVIFTSSATAALNLVAASFAAPMMGEGDEILLSIMEHHSNIVPWHFLRERQGAVIKWVDINDDGSFCLDKFEAALSDKTKIIAITHMSNVLGTITPIKKIVEIAHAKNIIVVVDGSQAVVHQKIDVQDLGADFYIMTGHKLYGPTGIGVLYGRYELLEQMRPFMGGGEMIDEVSLDEITYAAPPMRFEAGTPPIVQAIGLGAAIDYVQDIGLDNIAKHEAEIGSYANERLREINSLKMIGDAKGKGAIFSFEIEGAHAHDVSTILDRYGIAVRAGTHCAMPLLKRFGVSSTLRASFALYNGKDDVDALIDGLLKAKSFFA
ncbi:MAG: cysteine desulfurase [Devosiaceae bacterium]|nr:cysteine desulfurase [Devosiaceae bacterium]